MFVDVAYIDCFIIIIPYRGGYHGASPYAMGLTSMAAYKYPIATGIGCHTTMCPDVFRGPWGGSGCRDSPVQTIRECNCSPDCCQANDMYVQQLKEVLDTSVSQQIAGFFAEPIQGIGGVVQYPKGFLKEAYKLVRERGGVCIADEVQTGFGRTGSDLWGFTAHDVVPDIVTMAKRIANGFPMGAIVTTQGEFTRQNQTIEEDGLQQNSTQVGTYLLTELAKLRDKFGIIGDIRGKGLLIGVEMVKDKVSREPLPGVEMNEIFEDCKDMGLLIGKGGVYGQMSRIKPPMCITKDDADFALAVFGLAIQRQMARRL
ncbi:Alanine--glyoxylate aminotransferase 2, mitochondrial [Acipenser ruthenus]|uniref:Alanine--glyoxylate aminotransferase 2, mitochondrial n=1 Tax=Acipenser ruthenus TaxID=7906 RepID=A0A444U5Z5_ACIRT|nr:Alanine--glyoxylate aminotransferase 2, mitochondrial [Acipenser ruthenus]